MSATSQMSALVSLIADATKTIETLLRTSSKSYVPSLDDTTLRPYDIEISSIEMRKAVQEIEGACTQLCATVARSNHTIVTRFMEFYEPICMHVAVKFKIPDILQTKPAGMHISELGEKSGVEAGKIGRILRLLASKHCFKEVQRDIFANNRLSIQLLSSNPLSSLGLHLTDEIFKTASVLPETLADPEWGHSYSPEHTAFNRWSKHPNPFFSYYQNDEPEAAMRGTRFGIAILGWNASIEAGAVVQHFPWGELGTSASVCDVGGGIGNMTMQLAKAYPTLQLKLQDTPACIHQAKTDYWPKECPEAIRENRIEFKAIDFLCESPIKDCDVYYLKNVTHDWPNKECLKILSGISAAMAPKSRLLIQDYILQHGDRVAEAASAFTQAPEPLLPNYGAGRIQQYIADVNMMAVSNSRERSLEEFVQLGKEAGLRFVKLWDVGDSGMVEFCLA